MAFPIVFYTQSSTVNTINKVKTSIMTVTGTALEPMSIQSPVIKVKVDAALKPANYCYIAMFSRYYFIQDISYNAGFMEIQMKVDELESFKTDILAYNGIIERQQYDYNLYLEDNEMSAYSKSKIQFLNFPSSPLETNVVGEELKFVLITISD